jgi:hypoxanthine phosphoribosyltransferase
MTAPRPLIEADRIAARVAELGAEIRAFYGDETILCIGVLKGSFLFMADLVRAIDGDVHCGFLGVQSYEGTESTGEVRITHDLRERIHDRHVLIVEDIVDTGLTLSYLVKNLKVRGPRSLRLCTLLDKPSRRQAPVEVDFIGFEIPDAFVVGYGLDYDESYRNLPYVGVLEG